MAAPEEQLAAAMLLDVIRDHFKSSSGRSAWDAHMVMASLALCSSLHPIYSSDALSRSPLQERWKLPVLHSLTAGHLAQEDVVEIQIFAVIIMLGYAWLSTRGRGCPEGLSPPSAEVESYPPDVHRAMLLLKSLTGSSMMHPSPSWTLQIDFMTAEAAISAYCKHTNQPEPDWQPSPPAIVLHVCTPSLDIAVTGKLHVFLGLDGSTTAPSNGSKDQVRQDVRIQLGDSVRLRTRRDEVLQFITLINTHTDTIGWDEYNVMLGGAHAMTA
ncbi:hypothetical protein GGG16DRAFT_106640 [Schizophyllum commune]